MITCPSCGKQYQYQPQLLGQQVQCQGCGRPFTVSAPNGAPQLAPLVPLGSSGKRSDEIDYKIHGAEMQFAEVTLDPGEMVIAEAGLPCS